MPGRRPENVAAFDEATRLLFEKYGDRFPWTDPALKARIEGQVLSSVARRFPGTPRDVLKRAVRSGVYRALQQARYNAVQQAQYGR